MNWETIILSLLSCAFVGDIFTRLVFKSDRRVADAKADVAESEARKAAVEVRKAIEEAHAAECRHYEERLKEQNDQNNARTSELHDAVDKVNKQLNFYIERDIEKEKRFDEQTAKLREVQHKYDNALTEIADENAKNTAYEKRIGELELELERKRCDRLDCPFRLPPNVHTPTPTDLSIVEYFKTQES